MPAPAVDPPALEPSAALAATRTNTGATIAEISQRAPVLLVFLRHSGCTFCREALADLAQQRAALERAGTQLVLVHLSDDASFGAFAAGYGLGDVPRVSDPERALYRALGLRRASFLEMLNPRVWWRGFQAAILEKHGFGGAQGDVAQMPGVFLIRDGGVVAGHMHRSPADRPDYLEVCQLPASSSAQR
jgi:peroxiredoxin